MPAERADVIIDFSAFAGKTIILYNDGTAAVPAADSRLDYYTGDLDQTGTGGTAKTLPGLRSQHADDHAVQGERVARGPDLQPGRAASGVCHHGQS